MPLKIVEVTPNDAGQRVDRFIQKTFPLLPVPMVYKLIRTKDIKVNSKRTDISYRLAVSDVVSVYCPDGFLVPGREKYPFLRASSSLDIVYEDDNVLLMNKPTGLLCHPDNEEYDDTLLTRMQRVLYERGEYVPENENSFAPALANRIDRNTSGIVIGAKNAEALRVLNQKIKAREIRKFYLCVLTGRPPEREGVLTGYLLKDEKKNTVRIFNKAYPGAKSISTAYRVLAEKDGLVLCEVELLTGRTHQIRAHFASIGCPLLGDGKYGRNDVNKKFGGYKKQCLCSYRLIFDFVTDPGPLAYLNGREFSIGDVWFRSLFD